MSEELSQAQELRKIALSEAMRLCHFVQNQSVDDVVANAQKFYVFLADAPPAK